MPKKRNTIYHVHWVTPTPIEKKEINRKLYELFKKIFEESRETDDTRKRADNGEAVCKRI